MCFFVASVSWHVPNKPESFPTNPKSHNTWIVWPNTACFSANSFSSSSFLVALKWQSRIISAIESTLTPKLLGDDNPDLSCSFIKVITVVVHSSNYTAISKKTTIGSFRSGRESLETSSNPFSPVLVLKHFLF